MSKTIYFLGAGASYGKRDVNGNIQEGLPVVSEIPSEIDAFRSFIDDAVIPTGRIPFHGIYQSFSKSIENEKISMLSDIDDMIQGIKEHATIDTYARKLYLTRNLRDFRKLKNVLSAFFVWEQLEHKPDNRYDTFLANVLEIPNLNLPKDISIISWNYDSQIETAYQAYRKNLALPFFEKNLQGEWPTIPNDGRIIKINGSATFFDMSAVSFIQEEPDVPVNVQLIQCYNNVKADTSSMGFQFQNHLSFAWEQSQNSDNMRNVIADTVKDTEQVVVIGYSFPFFNRETDRQIFSGMYNLNKVYVQDINAEAVIQSLNAVLPMDRKIDVLPIKNCDQFYLPMEL